MARGSVVKGLSKMSKILKFLFLPFLDPGTAVNLFKTFKTISGSFGVLLNPFSMRGPRQGTYKCIPSSSDMWLISICQYCCIRMKWRWRALVEPVLHMASLYLILTSIGGTVSHVFNDCFDNTLLTKGQGPHLLATGRQTMKSVWTNKVVFFHGHMCEY